MQSTTDCPNYASPQRCPSNSPAPWNPDQPKPRPCPCIPTLLKNPPSAPTGKPPQAALNPPGGHCQPPTQHLHLHTPHGFLTAAANASAPTPCSTRRPSATRWPTAHHNLPRLSAFPSSCNSSPHAGARRRQSAANPLRFTCFPMTSRHPHDALLRHPALRFSPCPSC